jgi:outer membrane protein OmpA-like peptidoglycan-associated protein
MNRLLIGAAVAAIAAFGGAGARAQLVPGFDGPWYVGGEGGWTSLDNAKGSAGSPAPPAPGTVSGNVRFSSGFNVGARAGFMSGPWRFEEEFRYQNDGVSNIAGRPGTGHLDAYAAMTNAIYDFNLGMPVSPHIGAGIGAVDLVARARIPNTGQSFHGSSWQFGYQAIAGIRYNINPSLALDLDYRYLGTTNPTFVASTGGGPAVAAKSSYSSQNLIASLSLLFVPPPSPPPVVEPAAVPAPPPAVRQVFLVFFDWDRDTITPQGEAIIQQAATAYKTGAPIRIMITGYTDRSGSPGYNQRLSERRANNVANALAHLGVLHDQMEVSGRGENDNRVPTAPGVREPQNRRVEIVF